MPEEVLTLTSMRENETGRVRAVRGGPGLAGKLAAMGIMPGSLITKRTSADGKGPVLVEVLASKLALGTGMASKIEVTVTPRKLLLAGNPNVGKSVVFARLTGIEVISSNYPGTTVEYTAGRTVLAGERFDLVDVPGAYSLEAANKAEEVARKILLEPDAALTLNVLDSTNLERNLYFTLELLQLRKPVILLLNKKDIAERKGITINTVLLEEKLGVKVVPFVATTGEGLSGLQKAVQTFKAGKLPLPRPVPPDPGGKWKLIGEISARCQSFRHKHPTLLEKFEDITSRPATGLPFAALALIGIFLLIRSSGEGMINSALDPLFNNYYLPFVSSLVEKLFAGAPAAKILLLGTNPQPMQSFGLLNTGVYIPFIAVFPYIIAFYLALGVLEDIGYLPRLAVLFDNVMHRVGLHGYSTIPLMLGLGCKVPAIFAVRVLETRRERVIATALTLTLAPCMPQTAMLFTLLAPYNIGYVIFVFAVIAAAGAVSGLLLGRLLKGETPELFIEIPHYQLPSARALSGKVYFRMKDFFFEAVPMIALGVLLVGLIDASGLLKGLENFLKPVVTGLLGLPEATVSVLTLGFLRKDISIAMLAPFNLPPSSIAVAGIFLSLYLPCMAALSVTIRELGMKDALKVFALNFFSALVFASAAHLILRML